MDDLYKFPRLFVTDALAFGTSIALAEGQAHYLKNVLRRENGDHVRLFNGRDGEWLCMLELSGKKGVLAVTEKQTRPQPARRRRVHLLFAPLKKDRLDVLIEKAVELDATDLHPVLTDRTEVREIKEEKILAHIIEAAEQCERLDIPALHPIQKLDKTIAGWQRGPVFAGLERSDAKFLSDALVPTDDCAALVGPVGGWTDGEREFLSSMQNVQPVSLGTNILRSETAVAVMLARLSKP
ncbi:MAG: 16S rRNA (uracil(1498)-N(3))-methyltransferase [Proteobacteria bacterium]|nr:16S rRNA (uracil(1498)-N(3))-methyltransferase [Pseudomonadota bacterium]